MRASESPSQGKMEKYANIKLIGACKRHTEWRNNEIKLNGTQSVLFRYGDVFARHSILKYRERGIRVK